MKNTKTQNPNTNETPSIKPQARLYRNRARFPGFEFGSYLLFGFRCLVFFSNVSASAQTYSIDWHTIDDGGGDTSTGPCIL